MDEKSVLDLSMAAAVAKCCCSAVTNASKLPRMCLSNLTAESRLLSACEAAARQASWQASTRNSCTWPSRLVLDNTWAASLPASTLPLAQAAFRSLPARARVPVGRDSYAHKISGATHERGAVGVAGWRGCT
jgi:hypothetical protein